MSRHERTNLISEVGFHGFTIGKYGPYGLWHITSAPDGVFVVVEDGTLWRPASLRSPRSSLREAQQDVLDFLAEETNNKNKKADRIESKTYRKNH